jgi:uncharacterized membrane protein YadS
VSAIIATRGAIEADDEDASFAIAAILALGALALFTFPPIGHWLGMSDRIYGLWAGTGVDNTAEAVAAGALYSDAAAKIAVLAKTTRNAMIGFVVLGYALYWAAREGRQAVGNKAAFLWQKFPKFVLGFLLISLLASLSIFNKDQVNNLANLSKVGVSADVCRSRLAHKFQGNEEAGIAAVHCRSARRGSDRGHYAGTGAGSEQTREAVA